MKLFINFRFAFLLIGSILCVAEPGCKKDIYSVPELLTGKVSSITFTSAKCEYTITSDGGQTISARGVCWSTNQMPTIEDSKTTDNTVAATTLPTISGLTYNTTYYVRAYATNSEGTGYGDQVTFITLNPGLPTVTTTAITAITETTAICGGNVTSSGGVGISVIARGLCWSTSPTPTLANNYSLNGVGMGIFSQDITGLTFNTTYYVRAYAANAAGVAYGNEVFFTAGQNVTSAVVTTWTINNITQTTAQCGGNISSDGGATVTTRGVCWSTIINPTTINSHTTDGTGIGSFSSNLTNLNPNTTYYVKAYATNIAGTSYGSQESFTTITLPTVTTNSIIDITAATATGGGNISDDGGANITARGVCWSTSINPTLSDYYSVDGTGTGSYFSYLTGLGQSITYYVRAYATNIAGTSYGSQVSFTTSAPATLTTNSISNITLTTATGGGNITSDGGSPVTARGVCWSPAQNPTLSDPNTNDGTGIGSFTSIITGLNANTIYYVRAFATNISGTTYGSQVSFTTLNLPTLTTNSLSNIGITSAIGGGNITSDGGTSITARGNCWSTSQNPTTSNSHTTNGTGTGSFTSLITGLTANTIYYVKAYATTSLGTAYGNEVSFTSASTLSIGQSYRGGIIAYILQSGDPGYIFGQTHGLIAASSDQSTGAIWGCSGTLIGGTLSTLGTGQANTSQIVNDCPTSGIAAQLCNNYSYGGYNDWYLPSKDELNKLYLNKNAIGGITGSSYWSSTEYDDTFAWYQLFFGGSQSHTLSKGYSWSVRAIRTF